LILYGVMPGMPVAEQAASDSTSKGARRNMDNGRWRRNLSPAAAASNKVAK
jgi:hypothetical protein